MLHTTDKGREYSKLVAQAALDIGHTGIAVSTDSRRPKIWLITKETIHDLEHPDWNVAWGQRLDSMSQGLLEDLNLVPAGYELVPVTTTPGPQITYSSGPRITYTDALNRSVVWCAVHLGYDKWLRGKFTLGFHIYVLRIPTSIDKHYWRGREGYDIFARVADYQEKIRKAV